MMSQRNIVRLALHSLVVLSMLVSGVGSAAAAVGTDQADYAPGSTVTISGNNSDGAGYAAGETVHVDVSGPNGYAASCDGAADDSGAWSCQVTLNGDDSAVGDYSYTATGQSSGVSQAGSFTDGPPTYQQGEVDWDGNGAHGGICESFLDAPDLEPEEGYQGWLFILTKPFDPSADSILSATFSDGDYSTSGFHPGGDNGAYHYIVYTSAGATLETASATNGSILVSGNGNGSTLTVSHCEVNDPDTAEDLTVSKTADTSYDRTYTWTIAKDVDKTLVKQIGGSATFNYTVTVTHDAGTDSNWTVSGTITVHNPNSFDVSGVDVTDNLCEGSLWNGTVAAGGDASVDYSCAVGSAASGTNTATATWPDIGSPNTSASGSADYEFGEPTNLIDECVDVTDTIGGHLGTVCVGDANPTTFNYSNTVPVPQWGCVTVDNTATFTANDTGATGSASQAVQVCGPIHTGALTMGFWQNKNGQGIIKSGASTDGVCNSGTWLRQYAPFQDLSATATCTQVAAYVTNVIKAANASGSSMNAMLKAQMLATALDVYFSDPALGGNRIGASVPIGGVLIDLTYICKPGNTSLCENVSGAFGGADSMTVSQMLSYAASESDAGGSFWYGNVKATQELAKDAFDAINNQIAFAP